MRAVSSRRRCSQAAQSPAAHWASVARASARCASASSRATWSASGSSPRTARRTSSWRAASYAAAEAPAVRSSSSVRRSSVTTSASPARPLGGARPNPRLVGHCVGQLLLQAGPLRVERHQVGRLLLELLHPLLEVAAVVGDLLELAVEKADHLIEFLPERPGAGGARAIGAGGYDALALLPADPDTGPAASAAACRRPAGPAPRRCVAPPR